MTNKFMIEIYTLHNGITIIVPRRGETDYAIAVEFLQNLVGGPCGKSQTRFGEIDFYYFQTEEQFESLMNFRSKLKDIFGPIPLTDD